MSINDYVRWFSEIRLADVPVVGGKNASLGELYSTLSRQGIRVPNGFALTAQAYRDAQRIKGEGDAKAAAIYARAYEQNPEFYAFYRSLEAYKQSFKSKSDVLVLEPNSEFFKYLKNSKPPK